MASQENEVLVDFSPEFKLFKNGKYQRGDRGPKTFVPPANEDQETCVSSKDISISPQVKARIYLPKLQSPGRNQKLPILIYYHGGGFCVGSAFQEEIHRFMNILASQANVVGVSVEYRLAPENPMPASYEDSWTALQWVASHFDSKAKIEKEPWLIDHADFGKIFINGDSAGGNIVHVMVMRAGAEKLPGDVKISGAILSFPYFWSSEIERNRQTVYYHLWNFVYPNVPGGIDNPSLNPWAKDAPSLTGLGCSKMLVIVGEKDGVREGGVQYVEAVKKSEWEGEIEMFDVQGEDHCFHLINLDLEKSKDVVKRIVGFITSTT